MKFPPFLAKNLKLRVFVVLYLMFFLVCFLLYPNQKFIVKGVTESNQPYQVEKVYNSTEIYYTNKTYFVNECDDFFQYEGDVYIPDIETFDFLFKVDYQREICYVTNTPSTQTRKITIRNSADIPLTYRILIEYYSGLNCWMSFTEVTPRATVIYDEIEVQPNEVYEGFLRYKQVYDLRPDSDYNLNSFSFIVGTPYGCKQVEKIEQIENTRLIKLIKNETFYKPIFGELNLTIKRSLFEKWTKGDDLSLYGCPSSYRVSIKGNSCYRKVP